MSVQNSDHRLHPALGALMIIVALYFFGKFFLSSLPAHGMETTRASAFVLNETTAGETTSFTTSSPSPTTTDPCLPLLDKIRYSSPQSAVDRTQRSAGTATALGLFLGVRIALGPKETLGAKRRVHVAPDVMRDKTGSDYALAVSDYRSCMKEQALQSMNDDWRWTR